MDDYVQRVRLRAYLIWERQGRPEGASEDHWHEAEKELSQEGDAAGLQAAREYDKRGPGIREVWASRACRQRSPGRYRRP